MHTKGYVQSRIQQVIAKIDEQMRRQIFRQNICHLLLGRDIHQFDILFLNALPYHVFVVNFLGLSRVEAMVALLLTIWYYVILAFLAI